MTRQIENLQELESIISAQLSAAGGRNSTLSEERKDLLDRYLAQPYPDDDKRGELSRVIMTDVADTVDAALPQFMEIFANGNPPGRFDPVGEEDEEAADQETEALHKILMEDNDGFSVIQTWIMDGLAQKNGYTKVWYDRSIAPQPPESYTDLTDQQLVMLLQDVGQFGEIVAQSSKQTVVEFGQPITLHDITIRRYDMPEGVKWAALPPEEVAVASQWPHVSLVGCPFVAHYRPITRSQLVAMGFEREQIEALAATLRNTSSSEHSARHHRGVNETATTPVDKSMEEVQVAECWLYADLDKDGIAELLHVFSGGGHNEVLRWRDGQPAIKHVSHCGIVAWTPKIQPHRHIGQSLAEEAVQSQAINTELMRQGLDNIAANNVPRVEIAEDVLTENTIDDYKASAKPGAMIRTKALGGMREIAPLNLLGNTMAMMEAVNAKLEKRTGVTAYNQGLDSESLNKTATGISKIMNASQQKILLKARNFANALREVYLIAHELMIKNSSRSMTMKMRGAWVDINPAEWRRRSDMSIEIGVGTGNRAEQMAYLSQILAYQKEALAAGTRLADERGLFNTLNGMVRAAGLKDVRRYFNDPASLPPPEPQGPTPEQRAAAMMADIEIAKFNLAKRKQEFDEQEAITRRDIDRDKNEGSMFIEILKLQGAAMEARMDQLAAMIAAQRDPTTGAAA